MEQSEEIFKEDFVKILVASDLSGFPLKQAIVKHLLEKNHEVIDLGIPNEQEAQPYVVQAPKVARAIQKGEAERGILICGTGIGMCIVANKFAGIRAASITDEHTAEMSRRYTDLNVLCVSGDMLSGQTIDRLVDIWLNTPFEGGRHNRRLEKIKELEAKRLG